MIQLTQILTRSKLLSRDGVLPASFPSHVQGPPYQVLTALPVRSVAYGFGPNYHWLLSGIGSFSPVAVGELL
jgi:hypothetical protein